VLALDPAALVAVALIEAALSLGHFSLLQKPFIKIAHVAKSRREPLAAMRRRVSAVFTKA
jgi:hypothetical protein